jgi:hypothetical protein
MRLALVAGILFSLGMEASSLPRIGLIEFYGLKDVRRESLVSVIAISRGDLVPVNFDPALAEKELRQAFEIPEGVPLPQNEKAILGRLKSVKGVHDAKLAVICCEADGTPTLFVGIQEQSQAPFQYRRPGEKQVSLPGAMVALYERFLDALSEAVQKGAAREDDSQGHALFSDETLNGLTREFQAYARDHAAFLAEVMHESSEAKQRTAAAWIIGYAADKRFAARELLRAIADENEQVRNNATRSLAAIITLSQNKPDLRIQVDSAPFIQMLHSLSWSDRNKATMVLLALTKPRPPDVLKALHERALEPLIEMANWQDSHHGMALTLLGRIAGLPDSEAEDLTKRPLIISRAMRKKF